jgi:nicotinamidase-related amidase
MRVVPVSLATSGNPSFVANRPKAALVIADALNPYDHEDADRLAGSAERAVPRLAQLIERCRAGEVPIIYVNDHHGDWSASGRDLADRARNGRRPDLVNPVLPAKDDPFIVKARHSAFYTTPLEYLLGQMGVSGVLLAGQVTEQCILYTALDAYVRHMRVCVVVDAVAHIDGELARAALTMIDRNMRGNLTTAAEADVGAPPPVEATGQRRGG